MKKLNILLSYCSYPVTTAAYFERALRKYHNVVTIGPKLPPSVIEYWHLENMKLEIKPHDIDTVADPDIKAWLEEYRPDFKPDLFLWIESVHIFTPNNFGSLGCPTACYLIDTHLHLEKHLEIAKNFDYTFIAQHEYIPKFKEAGIEKIYWLPLGCDPEIHNKFSETKEHEVGFVGSFTGNPRRELLLKKISEYLPFYYERSFWTEMAETISKSKIVFNNAVKNDLNMRVFEVMSIGTALLTDNPKNSQQDILFKDGEDLIVYDDDFIIEEASFYLENEELRELIAKRGREIVLNAHKYEDRCKDLLDVVLNGKPNTYSPIELREKSLKNLSVKTSDIYKSKRSFVIPVLDYSPASKYNIKTLLQDLGNIEGTVIVIFNSEKVAEEMKNHPRIDYYAIMSSNIGVAPAWNLGLNMSRTPITYILNSDLHIEKAAVEKMDKYLIQLPDAAIVGPQGSFFSLDLVTDIQYFDKGDVDQPLIVDAVSGFLFAVKTKYFNQGLLNFENRLAPCYFEEWDLGLKIRMHGLSSWVVPVTEYEHFWSGTIKKLQSIKYFDKDETKEEVYDRNRELLLKIWNKEFLIKNKLNYSLWAEGIIKLGELAISQNNLPKATEIFNLLLKVYPDSAEGYFNLAEIEKKKGNIDKYNEFISHAKKLSAEFEETKQK